MRKIWQRTATVFAHASCAAILTTGLVFAAPQAEGPPLDLLEFDASNSEEPMAAPKPRPPGMVVLTFDDALLSQEEHARRIVRKYGLPGTLFINTVDIDYEPKFVGEPWATMSWSQISGWMEIGWEIGSHSHTHLSLPTLGDSELLGEVAYSALLIERKLGVYPSSFASPYGDYDDRVVDVVRGLHDNHVGAWGGVGGEEGFNSLAGVDHYRVNRHIVKRDDVPEDVCALIARAGAAKSLLVLGFHGVVPEPRQGDAGLYELSVDKFDHIARCTLGFALQNRVELLTVKQALARVPHKEDEGQMASAGE